MLLHPLYKHSFSVGYKHGEKTFYNDFHLGEDYLLDPGHEVYAPEDGVIDKVMTGAQGGLTLCLKSDKYYYRFLHLLKVEVRTEGEKVQRGEIIAKTGGEEGHENSGNSTAPHLHFDIYDLEQGAFNLNNRDGFVNPEGLLGTSIPKTTKDNLKKVIAQKFYNVFGLMPSENHISYEAGKLLSEVNSTSHKDISLKKLTKAYNTQKRDYIKHHFNPYSYVWRYKDLRKVFSVNKLGDLRPEVEKHFRDIEQHWLHHGIQEGRTDDYAAKAEKQ